MIIKIDKRKEYKPFSLGGSVLLGYYQMSLLTAGCILAGYGLVQDILIGPEIPRTIFLAILTMILWSLTGFLYYYLGYIRYRDWYHEDYLINRFLEDIEDDAVFDKRWKFDVMITTFIDGVEYNVFKFSRRRSVMIEPWVSVYISTRNWNKIRVDILPRIMGKKYEELFESYILNEPPVVSSNIVGRPFKVLELDNKVILKFNREEIELTKEEYEDFKMIPKLWRAISKDDFFRISITQDEVIYALRKRVPPSTQEVGRRKEKKVVFDPKNLDRIILTRDPRSGIKVLRIFDKGGNSIEFDERNPLFELYVNKLRKERFKIIDKTKENP